MSSNTIEDIEKALLTIETKDNDNHNSQSLLIKQSIIDNINNILNQVDKSHNFYD